MRRAAPLLLLNLLVAGSAPAFSQGAPCPGRGILSFARKADLPRGVEAALGFAMAERGAPFQVTDVMSPGAQLPGSRLIAARQSACSLAIRYEYGGIAHGYATALLERRDGRWTLVRRR